MGHPTHDLAPTSRIGAVVPIEVLFPSSSSSQAKEEKHQISLPTIKILRRNG